MLAISTRKDNMPNETNSVVCEVRAERRGYCDCTLRSVVYNERIAKYGGIEYLRAEIDMLERRIASKLHQLGIGPRLCWTFRVTSPECLREFNCATCGQYVLWSINDVYWDRPRTKRGNSRDRLEKLAAIRRAHANLLRPGDRPNGDETNFGVRTGEPDGMGGFIGCACHVCGENRRRNRMEHSATGGSAGSGDDIRDTNGTVGRTVMVNGGGDSASIAPSMDELTRSSRQEVRSRVQTADGSSRPPF